MQSPKRRGRIFTADLRDGRRGGKHPRREPDPIEYIPGLQSAVVTELLIPGDDEEETEHFRQRYIDSFSSMAYGGNIAQYKEWVAMQDGVGPLPHYAGMGRRRERQGGAAGFHRGDPVQ